MSFNVGHSYNSRKKAENHGNKGNLCAKSNSLLCLLRAKLYPQYHYTIVTLGEPEASPTYLPIALPKLDGWYKFGLDLEERGVSTPIEKRPVT